MALVKRKPRTVPKVIAAASTYIDPLDCDSTISYKVVIGRRLRGSVQLADCTRKIEWYFSDDKSSVVKIDKAIEYMQAFRAAFIGAQKTRAIRKKAATVARP